MARIAWLCSSVAALALTGAAFAQEPAPAPRVQALLSQLTLDEKLTLTQGGKDPSYLGQIGYLAGVPRLHIPQLRLSDGPTGILNGYDMTALPQAIALAATFDTSTAHRYGRVLGADARASGVDVVLGPQVDIARTPDWGRNITAFGEDPFLTSSLATADVRGILEAGAMTVLKHYIGYNQAYGIGGGLNAESGSNFVLDDRQLHEIYLPGFAAGIAAGANGVMASYNKVNGAWSTENAKTLGILHDELKWDGFVVSDWHANHSTPSIIGGLDMEMPANGPVMAVGREPPFWGERLKAAIQSGQVPQSALDRAVTHVLSQMDHLGMLDGRRIAAPAKLDVEGDAQVAYAVAIEAAVLLKNDGVLPLAPKALGSLGLIGPNAGQLALGPGTGRAEGIPSRIHSPLEALKAASRQANISYAVADDLTGAPIPSSALTPESGGGSGLTRSTTDGAPAITDSVVDFAGDKAISPGRHYEWTGTLKAPATGDYVIMTQSWGGATNLYIDGALKAGAARMAFGIGTPKHFSSLLPTRDGLDNGQVTLHMEAGRAYKIRLTADGEPYAPMQVRLAWSTPDMRRKNIEDAIALAKRVDTPIVFAWARGGESFDPELNLSLPAGQDDLISAVADANPNTIVVLNTGNPVSMPWRGKVKAILEMWYPGQEGGAATADLLLGRAAPGGRLPITFPAKATDTPALEPGHPERFAGVKGQVLYSEGVLVGYRWYDERNIQPVYPFGHGLTYTTFAYSNLKVSSTKAGVDVSFAVKNTGGRAGSDAPQVYVGRPDKAPLPMAVKALAGFQRVSLEPGETKTVKVHVDPRQLSYWSTADKSWKVAGGHRAVLIGASSRDIRLRGAADIAAR